MEERGVRVKGIEKIIVDKAVPGEVESMSGGAF
jgi:hypothetical protein